MNWQRSTPVKQSSQKQEQPQQSLHFQKKIHSSRLICPLPFHLILCTKQTNLTSTTFIIIYCRALSSCTRPGRPNGSPAYYTSKNAPWVNHWGKLKKLCRAWQRCGFLGREQNVRTFANKKPFWLAIVSITVCSSYFAQKGDDEDGDDDPGDDCAAKRRSLWNAGGNRKRHATCKLRVLGWRRRRDSNPRTPFDAYALSRGASYSHLSTSPGK